MPEKTPSILLAGAAIGVAAALFNFVPAFGSCLVCLAYVGAGVLAVWHYTDRHGLTIKGGEGASMGALAGIVAMVVASLLQLFFIATGATPPFREQFERQLGGSGLDPAQQDQILQMFSSPLVIALFVVAALILYAILGAVGGAIGASTFRRGTET